MLFMMNLNENYLLQFMKCNIFILIKHLNLKLILKKEKNF